MWNENGLRCVEGYLKNGIRSELWNFWYDTGDKYAKRKITDGHKNGIWKIWNTSGTQMIVKTFNNNILDGEFIQYAGKVKLVGGNYKCGKTGIWTFSYPNGEKYAEGQFIDDQPMGCWIEWYPNGVTASESDYYS